MAEALIIKNWQTGMAQSPHLGMGLIRNADIEEVPGAIKVQTATDSLFVTAVSATFTADDATDICTLGSGSFTTTGTAVTVSSNNTLPNPLAANTTYFVIVVSPTTFKLATTLANALANTAIDITTTGVGVHTVTTINPGTVKHIVKDATNIYYFIDSNARVWFNDGGADNYLLNGNTLTNGVGNGLVVFQNSDATANYLFAFRGNAIDVVNVTGSANRGNPSWSNGWQTMNTAAASTNSHHAIVAQDNIIYFCDSRYIGWIKELPGSVFDPANGATFNYSNNVLDLPQGEVANWLEELGTNLLIAGDTYNKIYPWDRLAPSFSLPILLSENSVKKLKNIGNEVYILAGTQGNIFVTQGSYARWVTKIPEYVSNSSGGVQFNPVTWGGIGARNGALLFGAGVQTSGNSGVYILFPDGRMFIDNIPSTSSTNATAIFAEGENYYLGYASGADNHSTDRYSSFQTVVHSELYKLSTKAEKTNYSTLEVQLAKPAASGHVRVSYRTDTSSSFTTLASYTADGATTSFRTDIGLTDLENLQAQVELDGAVELMEVRFLDA